MAKLDWVWSLDKERSPERAQHLNCRGRDVFDASTVMGCPCSGGHPSGGQHPTQEGSFSQSGSDEFEGCRNHVAIPILTE